MTITTARDIIDAALIESNPGWMNYAAGHSPAQEVAALLSHYTTDEGYLDDADEDFAVKLSEAIFNGIEAAIAEGISDSDDGGLLQYGIGAALDLIPSDYVTI